MASLVPLPKFYATDNNGRAVPGGQLFTYIAGSNTKLDTYTTSAGNVANTNPVVMDTSGRADVWVDGSKLYKWIFSPSTDTDPPANPFWTVDNIGFTADGISFIQAGTGAVRRTVQAKLRQVEVSVEDFGAVGDGNPVTGTGTDDAAAFQRAHDYIASVGGGTVFCETGKVYYISTPVIWQAGSSMLCSRAPQGPTRAGTYGSAAILNGCAAGNPSVELRCDNVTYVTVGVWVKGISFLAKTNAVHGVKINNLITGFCYNIHIEQCHFGGGDKPMYVTGAGSPFNIYFTDCEVTSNQYTTGSNNPNYGIYSDATSGLGGCCRIDRLRCLNPAINPVRITGTGFTVWMDSCIIESFGKSAVCLDSGQGVLTITNTHTEAMCNTSYWNGTFYQVSSTDVSPVGFVQVATPATSANAGGQITLGAGNTINSRDSRVAATSGREYYIIADNNADIIRIEDGAYGTPGLLRGQPYVTWCGSNQGVVYLVGGSFEPMSGTGTGAYPVYGSLQRFTIQNCKGLTSYPLIANTDTEYQKIGVNFAWNTAAVMRTLVRQDDALVFPPVLSHSRKEVFSETLAEFVTNYNIEREYYPGDTAWLGTITGGAAAVYCGAAGSSAYTAAEWQRIPLTVAGVFTCAANTTTTTANIAVTASSIILLTPTNAAAATLMGGATSLYLSARTAGTSFAFTTANGAAAAGTETFAYVIVNT